MRNPILILATVVAAAALSLGLWSWQQWTQTVSAAKSAQTRTATVLPAPRPLPAVKLIDQDGQPFSPQALEDDWSLWFFGFTHCPDICPNTLGLLANVKQQLAQAGSPSTLKLVFVSVDPERDTPDKLKSYVKYFDDQMLGVTGDRANIDELTGGLYLPYVIETGEVKGQYNVEHSGALVLVGPDAAARAYFTPPHTAADLVNDLRLLTK